jgi:hypothetical protein
MEDFLSFRKMITPLIIKILFWVGVAFSVIAGLVIIISSFTTRGGGGLFLYGLMIMLIGPVIARIYCEILILFFRMHDSLNEIKELLAKKK